MNTDPNDGKPDPASGEVERGADRPQDEPNPGDEPIPANH